MVFAVTQCIYFLSHTLILTIKNQHTQIKPCDIYRSHLKNERKVSGTFPENTSSAVCVCVCVCVCVQCVQRDWWQIIHIIQSESLHKGEKHQS